MINFFIWSPQISPQKYLFFLIIVSETRVFFFVERKTEFFSLNPYLCKQNN
jgi:hypothetical protein